MKELVEEEESLMQYKGEVPPVEVLSQAKLDGFADKYLSELLGVTEEEIRDARTKEGGLLKRRKLLLSRRIDCLRLVCLSQKTHHAKLRKPIN
jgi:hypothetical protein